MAKDGDIIDVMFGWLISLFAWIFKGIFNLAIWLIKGIFSLIGSGISAIRGKKSNEGDTSVIN